MSTCVLPCGCAISRSMFGAREVVWVQVCFRHSVDDAVHAAKKQLVAAGAEFEYPENWQDPAVQAALVALAAAVMAVAGEGE